MIEVTPRNIRTWSMLGPCGAYGIAMQDLADEGRDISVVTADLRFYSGLERFSQRYPNDCYNVGIAEQNMLGVAAGMAREGCNVFATTYATFASTRCLDQVRVSMGYMKLPVKLVGLTSGLSVGVLGATHMSVEDLAIMRSIPNITVLSPSDCLEVIKATRAAADFDGPVYLRLPGGTNNQIVYSEDYDFKIGHAITLKEGSEICLIATGASVATAVAAADLLEDAIGCGVGVLNMHTIKPFDSEAVSQIMGMGCRLVVSLEEHSVIGGLGSAIADCMMRLGSRDTALLKLGIADVFPKAAAYGHLLETCRLTPELVSKDVQAKWRTLF